MCLCDQTELSLEHANRPATDHRPSRAGKRHLDVRWRERSGAIWDSVEGRVVVSLARAHGETAWGGCALQPRSGIRHLRLLATRSIKAQSSKCFMPAYVRGRAGGFEGGACKGGAVPELKDVIASGHEAVHLLEAMRRRRVSGVDK